MKHLSLMAVLLLTAALFAGQPDPSAMPGKCPMKAKGDCPAMKDGKNHLKILKEEIGVNDDQLKKLEIIRLDAQKSMEQNKHDIEMEKLALKEQSLKGTLTKARIKESLQKIDGLLQKVHAARYQGALSSIDVFTEEQLKKMAEKKMLGGLVMLKDGPDDRMDGKEGRKGPHGRPGDDD